MESNEESQRKAPTESLKSTQAGISTEGPWTPTLHQKLIIYMLGLTSLIVAMDASIIPTTLSAMVEDLDGDKAIAFWIGTSYLLVNAVTMPFLCSISEVFGRPICFQFSLAMFSIGTIVCCTAHSITQMLAGRCIQGVGGAGIHALGLVILCDIVPLKDRPKWYGVTLGGWAVGLSTGPIIGGGIVENTTWRVAFYIMFPVCAVGLIFTPWLLTLKPPAATLRQKFAKIDWIGGGLFVASSTTFLVGISWGGVSYEWRSAATIAPIVLGIVGMLATIIYENNVAAEPYLRKSLWLDLRTHRKGKMNWSAIATYINGCLQGFAMFGLLYYVPIYFMSVKGESAFMAGVLMLPILLPTLLSAIVTGRLVTRFTNYRVPICVGWALGSIGQGMLIAWYANHNTAFEVMTQIVIGVGTGAVLNAQNFACQAMSNPPREHDIEADGLSTVQQEMETGQEARAAAMYLFTRQFGFALGVAIGGTTFQNVMALKLEWLGLPSDAAQHVEAYISVLSTMSDGPIKQGIVDAYSYGFVGSMAVILGVAVVALILSVFVVEQFDMETSNDTTHVLESRQFQKP